MATCESRITAGTVESPLPGDWHGGFGERSGETGRGEHRNRAPDRLNKCRPGTPMAATAYDQPAARLKLRRRSGVPDEVAKTSAPGSGPAKAARCSRRSGMIARGTPTTRRAAFDLGGPRVTADPEARRL